MNAIKAVTLSPQRAPLKQAARPSECLPSRLSATEKSVYRSYSSSFARYNRQSEGRYGEPENIGLTVKVSGDRIAMVHNGTVGYNAITNPGAYSGTITFGQVTLKGGLFTQTRAAYESGTLWANGVACNIGAALNPHTQFRPSLIGMGVILSGMALGVAVLAAAKSAIDSIRMRKKKGAALPEA